MKKLITLFCVLTLTTLSFAQTTLTGKVTDSKKDPVIGASIIIKGTTLGTVTDINGDFSLKTNENEGKVVFSFIGMKTIEKTFSSSQNYEIQMEDDLTTLDDVMVIGYGTSKKSDITSSISAASNIDQLSTRPVSNMQDFLQGNIAGVTVSQNGGDPTEDATITIRGLGTVNIDKEKPLWVVDGMPYDGGTINPDDIESINVLKDASAAAIYGAEAGSGVIVVTTKSGEAGKIKVSAKFNTGVSQALNLPESATATEQNWIYNTACDNSGDSRIDAFDADENPYGAVTRTDWIDEIFRNASFYNASVALSGGSKKAVFSASANYDKRDGLLIATNSERLGLRLKSKYDINDYITIGENAYLSHEEAIGCNTSSSYKGVIMNAIYMPRSAEVFEEDGTYMGVTSSDSEYSGSYGDVYNPVALLEQPTTHHPVTNINANVYGEFKLFKGFKYRSSFALNEENDTYKKFTPAITGVGRATDMNYLDQEWSTTNKWIWDNQISYEKTFGDHKLDFTGVYSAQYEKYEWNYIEGEDFSREEEWYQYLVNAGDIVEYDSDAYEDALTSLIGRVRYSFKDKYLFTGSVRRDQTSRLSSDNKTDYFPSASAAWVLSKEGFLKDSNWLNQLKIRLSWGQIGNVQSVDAYAYDVAMASQKAVMGDGDAQQVSGYYVSKESNPDLKWETSESYDAGVDLSVLQGKFEVTADYYQKYTYGLIGEDNADSHLGVDDGATVNMGDVKNSGFEFAATYNGKIRDLSFSVNANIAHNQNELLNLDGYSSTYITPDDYTVRSTLSPYRSTPGEELYSYYLVPCLGIFQSQEEVNNYVDANGDQIQPDASPGDLKFKDVDGSGGIGSGDKVYMGNGMPDLTYGVNLSAKYKGFDLAMIFQGVAGVKLFNAYKYTTYNASVQNYNLDRRVLKAWSEDNPNSDIPMLRVDDPNSNFGTESDWYLENGDYLRMKNLTIGYTLPSNLMNRLYNGSSLRVYFSCDNVFTVTKYSGMDPEVGGVGLDVGSYPVARTISGGVALNF